MMIENVDEINKLLDGNYGRFDGINPRWRVVWSEDQLEKRWGKWEDKTKEGIFLRYVEEVREVKKYTQYCFEKYILETLRPVHDDPDLIVKVSYEPVWTFMDKNGNALPPRYDVCKLIIDTIHHNMNHRKGIVEHHPLADPKTADEVKRAKLDDMYQKLYGNETQVTTALSQQRGVIVP